MSALITVNNIVKKYKNFTLDKVSFELESGHIYGFVGENGSGKSTTMKAISSLINLDDGHVLINGKESKDLEPEEREKLGFTLDEICLPDNLKIRLINNILKSAFENWDETLFFKYLTTFNIDANKKIKELSKGMKAKFNIIISLCHGANILILDEPMNGLDPVARDEFCTLLNDYIEIHNGKIILNESKKVIDSGFLKLTLNEDEFEAFDKFKIVRFKKMGGNYDVLIANSEENKNIPNVEKASAEDILIFLIKGKTL